jgi:hypothetical protein
MITSQTGRSLVKSFNEFLRVLHFIGLALGFAVPAANMVMGGLIAKAAPPEKGVLGRFPPLMSRLGKVGLVLVWVTGLILVYTKWAGFATFTWPFWAKLGAVALLTITVTYIHALERRVRDGDASALPRIETFGKIATACTLLALVFAVVAFG